MSAIRLDRVDWTAPPEAVIPAKLREIEISIVIIF
jgi:hypothetical protein